jgi:hypothetical protein
MRNPKLIVSLMAALQLLLPLGVAAQAQPAAAQAQPAAKPLSKAELDQLVAPIALYPDALLAQILMASTYPLEIVGAARWSQANPKVAGKALEDAMQKQAWDPSVKSLAAFPQVLGMMSDKLDWTQKLGDAFLGQRADTMKTVQSLRLKAQQAGNLKSTAELKVVVEKQVIIIEPATTVVYVPVYNRGRRGALGRRPLGRQRRHHQREQLQPLQPHQHHGEQVAARRGTPRRSRLPRSHGGAEVQAQRRHGRRAPQCADRQRERQGARRRCSGAAQ